uniref:Secreted protein n=1 Tax=Loa loa TaxID=7209 RepID=A0A1I7VG00_LOALO
MSFSTILLILSILIASEAHPQFRKLVCITKDLSRKNGKEASKCHLVLKDTEYEEPGRAAPKEAGCFTEKYNATISRVFCDIFCPNAHTHSNYFILLVFSTIIINWWSVETTGIYGGLIGA